jgi:hypothetical protein
MHWLFSRAEPRHLPYRIRTRLIVPESIVVLRLEWEGGSNVLVPHSPISRMLQAFNEFSTAASNMEVFYDLPSALRFIATNKEE